MSDLIDRAQAQTELQFAAKRYTVAHEAHGEGHVVWSDNLISVADAMNALRNVPSAELGTNLAEVGADCISRQAAIDLLSQYPFEKVVNCLSMLEEMPSAQSETFEWCTDCKEYDQERHCCHRFTKVIRDTVEELKVVRCKDCIYGDYKGNLQSIWCSEGGQGKTVAPYDFCSYGERKIDG